METLTLNYLRKGESAKILHVYAQGETKKHLTSLGFVPGASLQVLATHSQEMILKLKETRLGVSKEFTRNISVERLQFDETALISLADLPVGSQVKVVRVEGEAAFRKHIMDMGVTKNARIDLIKIAPLGDPLEIRVRGYQLSLRKNEAQHILTLPVKGGDH